MNKKRSFAYDYSQYKPDPEALRCVANRGLRFNRDVVDMEIRSTWDVNISPDGIVYFAPACEHTKEIHTKLIAYDYDKDKGYICYDSKHYTLPKDRQLPHTKLHESITFLPDGRVAATTHSTSRAMHHPEWMPFAHMHHVWDGFPGSYLLIYDPKTGEVENWGIPVPRETVYGMTYDKKHNCLYMIGFMKGHVYRFSIDDRTVIDLGKAAEVFCYRLHAGPDGHIYGMTKSGYLFRANVDTVQLEDLNWRHPAYYDNSFNNTWYRYMAHAHNISDHEFVFHSYTSDDFYLYDCDTGKVRSLGPKFTHDDHNNVRHTEFCLNEFAVDRYGALWYMVQPVSRNHPSTDDPRKYVLPSYLMHWDIRNNRKPENLGVVSDNTSLLSYSTGVCYDPQRDILHLVGTNLRLPDEYNALGICSIDLKEFRPAMAEKGEICRYKPYQFTAMTQEEINEVKEKVKVSPFPIYVGEEVAGANPFQAFPVDRITPLRLWRDVPHTDIPASKVIGLAWDDQGKLHGLCGDKGEPQYYFGSEEHDFEVLGKTMAEVDENPVTWLYKGILGPFTPERRGNEFGVRPPKAFSYKTTVFTPYAELDDTLKNWLKANLLPGSGVAVDENWKMPEVAGRRYLSRASYAVEWNGGRIIAGTLDGLLGIVKPDGSVFGLGNAAPFGPVRCMCTNAAKTQLWGVVGDDEDMGMVFYFDEEKGICQVGHINYNIPNFMDGPTASNVLSSIALSPDEKHLAIGGADRMGAVHIVDAAAARFV
ncbi:MAG: hypothetical protein GX173_03655 [Ruminococcaceae bacterium]|nr:hypothetical protein [Oscillospiraceae bacterium]